ncbi:MAG: Rieske 2Fe-2S domain-containing protein [Stellaceae bacterium]
MLTEANNKTLTQTAAGTPMGDLLRRYWYPIAATAELEEKATKRVRLLGENLVLYKDLGGRYGLVDRHCPHRRADLAFGFVEECGLRCHYHGWLFNEEGRCLEQPFDDTVDPSSRYKDKTPVKAYPVEAKAGLLWAYMGPKPAPLLPDWEPFNWKNGFVQIVFSSIPCNWFQGQENSIDPVHFEWMHANWGGVRLKGKIGPYGAKHVKVGFEEFDYGYVYKRVREDTDENNPLWSVGRVCLWPNCLFTGGHFEWRVPVDDENTLSVGWFFNRVPKDRDPYVQNSIPYWIGPVTDEKTGEWLTGGVMNQDFAAWIGQGAIADRSQEHLARSDRGITMIRNRFFEDMETIAKGGDPKAVIRDANINSSVPLPIVGRKLFIEGLTREQILKVNVSDNVSARRFVFQQGQPEHVKRAYEEAMGFKMEEDFAVSDALSGFGRDTVRPDGSPAA